MKDFVHLLNITSTEEIKQDYYIYLLPVAI